MKKYQYTLLVVLIILFGGLIVNVVLGADADEPDFPTAEITTVPETVQPNGEITLSLEFENFTGESLFTNWCIDGIPLNTFYAGSSDEISFEESQEIDPVTNEEITVQKPKIMNEYGRLYGGSGFCNYPIKTLGGEDDNVSWWKRTKVGHIEESGGWIGAIFGRFNDIPRIAMAYVIGFQDDPDIIENKEYQFIDFRGEEVPAAGNFKAAEEDPLLELLELDSSRFRIEDGISYIYVDNNEELLSSYRDILQNQGNAYVIGSEVEVDFEVSEGVTVPTVKIQIYESYEYFKLGDVSEEVEDLESDGYEVDILWNNLRDSGETDEETGQPLYEVKIWIFEPPAVTIEMDEYINYFNHKFPDTDNSRFFMFDDEQPGYAFINLFNRYMDETWDDNRNNLDRENPVVLSRVFHEIEKGDQQFEEVEQGNINPDDGLPEYIDFDKDGIPDLWEMKHFGDMAGEEVIKGDEEEARVHFPPCCSPVDDTKIFAFLTSVVPSEDWEFDGFDYFNKAYSEQSSWYSGLYATPYAAGLGPPIERHRFEGGSGEKQGAGDKKWTNYEEFVAGTNPVAADSDADGIPDELDFYGLSQDSIGVKLNKADPTADYLVKATMYGKITRGTFSGEPDFSRLDIKRSLKQGGSLGLEVRLARTPDPATITDDIVVSAGVGNIQNIDEKLLYFQWYLNDFAVPGVPGEEFGVGCPCTYEGIKLSNLLGNQSGFGKTDFKFPASLGASRACDAATVTLEVTDPETGNTVAETAEIPITLETILYKTVVGNVADPGTGVGEEGGISEDDQQVEDVSETDMGGFRTDDKIEIVADLVGYNEEACGAVPAPAEGEEGPEGDTDEERFENSLTYNWKIDGVEKPDISGKGVERRKINFQPTSGARNDPNNRDVELSTTEMDDHMIEVEIYDDDKNLISKKNEGIKVLGPHIEMDTSGEGIIREPTEVDGENIDQVNKGTSVTVRAQVQYFRPAESYVYTWSRNGIQVGESTEVNTPISEYTFTAGDTDQPAENVSVSVTSKSETGEELETALNDIALNVYEEEETTEEITSFIRGVLPGNVKSFFNVFAALSLVALMIILSYSYTGVNKRK